MSNQELQAKVQRLEAEIVDLRAEVEKNKAAAVNSISALARAHAEHEARISALESRA